MHILFEQHRYPLAAVEDDCWEGVSADPDGLVTFDYVGYFYNEQNGRCVLILPRVLLEDIEIDGKTEERVFVERDAEKRVSFAGFRPEEIVDPEARRPDGTPRLSSEQRRFLREFAVWIYRAINLYWKNVVRDDSADGARKRRGIHRRLVPAMGRGAFRKSHTLLDVILALRAFQRENADFFLRVLRERTAGAGKVNWTRTVIRSPMLHTKAGPLYTKPVTRTSEIDFDEELFTVFYSILAHVQSEYGFEKLENPGFAVLPHVLFRRYLNGYGAIRLKQIRNRYFSDRALRLWDLCYSFFAHHHAIRISGAHQEYLLAKDFQIVFEAMIDELIGDRDVPDGLKEQDDGKRVDHLYRYPALECVDGERGAAHDVFYIGDSKYYKRRTGIGDNAVYKQFTYARNVVQWNLDLFLDDKVADDVEVHKGVRRLRNEATEGYAVIPNFFISARIDDDLRYDHPEVVPTDKAKRDFLSRQFENRLFDRDTFLVAHYDVNFLYVLSLYARNCPEKRKAWREAVRAEFCRRIRALLQENFTFYVMTPRADTAAAEFFHTHFRDVIGKVYDPYGTRDGFAYYSLALRKSDAARGLDFDAENARVKNLLTRAFRIGELNRLGDRPERVVRGEAHDPTLAVSGFAFADAVKILGKKSTSFHFAKTAIRAMRAADAFICAEGTGILEHPERLQTVFLFEAGNENRLAAILQVTYCAAFPTRTAALAYRADGIDGTKLAAVPTGGAGIHWLWRIANWVDV